MTKQKSYRFMVGKKVLIIKSKTSGLAYDRAMQWCRKYAPYHKPVAA